MRIGKSELWQKNIDKYSNVFAIDYIYSHGYLIWNLEFGYSTVQEGGA